MRFTAISSVLSKFIEDHKTSQVVSLGAGFDSLFFLLKQQNKTPRKFFEVDFPEITAKKASMLCRNKQLSPMLQDKKILAGGISIDSQDYALVGADLRNWSGVVEHLLSMGFDLTLPTLFLSECLFVYMEPKESDAILQWISGYMSHAVCLVYEPTELQDAFGKVLIENLKVTHTLLNDSTQILPTKAHHFIHIDKRPGTQKHRHLSFHALPTRSVRQTGLVHDHHNNSESLLPTQDFFRRERKVSP